MKRVTIIDEFKTFVGRGHVVDVAIAVTISTAFTALVNAIVNDLIGPWLGFIFGNIELGHLALTFDGTVIRYGSVIQAAINFIFVSIVVFFVVKTINSVQETITGHRVKIEDKPTEKEILEDIHTDIKKKVINIQPALKEKENRKQQPKRSRKEKQP